MLTEVNILDGLLVNEMWSHSFAQAITEQGIISSHATLAISVFVEIHLRANRSAAFSPDGIFLPEFKRAPPRLGFDGSF